MYKLTEITFCFKLLVIGVSLSTSVHASDEPFHPRICDLSPSYVAIKNFNRLAEQVYDAPDEASRDQRLQDILTFVEEHPEDPYSFDLLEVVYEYFPLREDKKSTMPLLRRIAFVPDHPKMRLVLGCMRWSGNQEDKNFAIQRALAIAQNPNDWRRFDVSSRFLNSFSPSDSSGSLISSVILPVMREIAQDPNHPNQDDAMLGLWSYSLQRKDIEFSRSNLYKMVKDKKHPKRINAAIALFNKESDSARDTARPVLYEVVESTSPNSRGGITYALNIASMLLTSGNEEDKKIGEQTLHRLINSCQTRMRYLADLYNFGKSENRDRARSELHEIARDIGNPDAYFALSQLLHSQNPEDIAFSRHLLRQIVTSGPDTLNYFYAMTNLWRSYPIVEEDRVLVRPLLRSIASDPSNHNAVQAATTLFYGNEDDKNFVRPILYQAANNQDHIGYETQDVASVLWYSAEAADKEVARQNFYEAVKRNPKAVHIFQRLLEGNEKDVNFALGHLQTMISECGFSGGFTFSVWNALWRTNKGEVRDLARPHLKGIALNPDSFDMARSISTLWYGNDEDEEIARKAKCYAALVGYTNPYPTPLLIYPNRYPEDKRLISRLSMSKAFRSIFSEAVSAESLEGKRKQKYFTMSQVLENQSIYFIIYEYVDDIVNAAEDLDLQAAHGEAFVINN